MILLQPENGLLLHHLVCDLIANIGHPNELFDFIIGGFLLLSTVLFES